MTDAGLCGHERQPVDRDQVHEIHEENPYEQRQRQRRDQAAGAVEGVADAIVDKFDDGFDEGLEVRRHAAVGLLCDAPEEGVEHEAQE